MVHAELHDSYWLVLSMTAAIDSKTLTPPIICSVWYSQAASVYSNSVACVQGGQHF